MIEKHACAVDADGYYKTIVLMMPQEVYPPAAGEPGEEPPAPETRWVIDSYTLQEGESLVELTDTVRLPAWRPNAGEPGLIRPQWDGTAWVEGGTAEEIAAWEAGHPAPPPPGPTEAQALGQMITDEQLERIAQGQEYTDLELAVLGGTSHV